MSEENVEVVLESIRRVQSQRGWMSGRSSGTRTLG